MDFTEIITTMKSMSDAQVKSIQDSAYGILKERENVKKIEAIQNFKKAFTLLQDLGISVFVEYDDDEEDIRINNEDDFNFY